MKKITIIGAGIGGLTAAIALEQKGFEVEIFEAFPQMKRIGAGIVLANNATQVYQRLGLFDTIAKRANHIKNLRIVDDQMNPLTDLNMREFETKLGVHYVSIHRGDLQEVLIDQLKTTKLQLGKRLSTAVENADGIELTFEDGSKHNAEIVLAADGIHSKVREQLFPGTTIRNAKQICWRGVTTFDLPANFKDQLNESWGKRGTRFGIVPLANKEVYWFALCNYKDDFRAEFASPDLSQIFKGYHPIVGQLLEATPMNQVLTNEINDLKPLTHWYSKQVCLIGDAAHATTPNMGQGACQSIEDGLAISICLNEEESVEKAFARFQSLRLAKANNIISKSWNIGKLAQMENSIGRWLRNSAMKMTPTSLSQKQVASVFELGY